MKTIWISLIVFVFILNARGGLCYTCGLDAYNHCFQNDMVPNDVYDAITSFRFITVSRDLLKSVCRVYNDEISGCLVRLAHTCTGYYQAMFQGYRDAFDYICNEGFEGYVKHSACFASYRATAKMGDCAQGDVLFPTCSYFDDAHDCTVDATEDVCGKEASEWMETYDRKTTGPLMDEMGCNTMDGPTTPGPMNEIGTQAGKLAGIIVGSIVGVAALLALACYICVAVRKRRMNHPPPYSMQTDLVQSPVPAIASGKMGPPPSYSETCHGVSVKQV